MGISVLQEEYNHQHPEEKSKAESIQGMWLQNSRLFLERKGIDIASASPDRKLSKRIIIFNQFSGFISSEIFLQLHHDPWHRQ